MANQEEIIRNVAEQLLDGNVICAKDIIKAEYPHCPPIEKAKRNYTEKQKFEQYVKDGFVDRYSGKRLLNPGILRTLSFYFPVEFPYQKNWKMQECHRAYWDLVPTIDHIVPIAIGGEDVPENWATTSMLNNSIKNNFTLEQLQWKLHPAGKIDEWDGLTGLFILLVEKDAELLQDGFIKRWYSISKKMYT